MCQWCAGGEFLPKLGWRSFLHFPFCFAVRGSQSYSLTIPADGSPVTLVASTVFGAYMGLQTLSQVC